MLIKMLWKIWTMRMLILFALMSMFCDRSQAAAAQQCGTWVDLTLTVELGETAVLPCTLETSLEGNQRVIWRKGSGDSLVEYTTQRNCSDDRLYDSRLQIVTYYKKKFKLNITNAQLEDTATYHCDFYKESSWMCEASKVTLNVNEQHVSPVSDSSTVSIISSTAFSEISTTNLPNEYISTPIAMKRNKTVVFLTIFIATLLILVLFAAVCCCMLVNKFEIHLRPGNNSIRFVNTNESNLLEMKLMGEVGAGHLSEDIGQNGMLLETRENRHLDPLKAQSDRFIDIQTEKERLNPKLASSEDSYEIVTCPDPTYFVVNGSNCEYDVFSTIGTSNQPASTSSRSIDKLEIIGKDTNILSIKPDQLTLPPNGGSSASSSLLQRVSDTETTSDCPKGTEDQDTSEGPPLPPIPADLQLKQRRKHLSCPPSLGESKITIISDAVSATKLYPPPTGTTNREGLIASRGSEKKAERVDTFHNFEMIEQQHPFNTGGYCNRDSHPTPPPPPLPPLTLPRRQQPSRPLTLQPLPLQNTLPQPPLQPQPSAPVPHHPLQPELQDGYNSLLGMTYDGTYDRLKRYAKN